MAETILAVTCDRCNRWRRLIARYGGNVCEECDEQLAPGAKVEPIFMEQLRAMVTTHERKHPPER